VRLVWVVIPLVIFGIIGMQESFAEESEISVTVQGGELLDFISKKEVGTMNIKIVMEKDGQVILDIPKTVWHIADSSCNSESPMILVDGRESTFIENITVHDRIIQIDVSEGDSHIEIISGAFQSGYANVETYGKFCAELENGNYLSPKKQLQLGFGANQVICKDDMILVNKYFPRPPVCVTYHTALSLIERGVIHDVNWEKNAVNKATSFVLRNMDDDFIVTNGDIVTEIISARNSPVFSKISMFVNFTLYDKIRDNINQYSLIVAIRNGYVMTPEFIQTTTFNADTESWDKSLIPFNVSFFEDELNKQRIECKRAEQMVQKRLEDNPLAIYGDRPVHTCHEFLEQWEQDYEEKLSQIDKNKENGIG